MRKLLSEQERKTRALASQRKYTASNRKWINDKAKDWYHRNKDQTKDRLRKSRYSIGKDAYLQMLINQQERCLGFGTHQSQLSNQLCVDHCHSTGFVRGLLCQNCNTALGMVKDSPSTLENLINYLKETEMRKKNGGSDENKFDPTEMPKEDPARRAGRADDNKALYPKTIQVAELAIADQCYKECDFEESEETVEKDKD